ncbi:MAG: hypothetical protein HC769_15240 [Cyanobacteria bacterium CRU_2_1]|nr:hypothetical protein [Cyanobacteria bacterium RU_5_0]NJR60070.1 hypothetical protein [Cyanobacteria bacterium CRU_2_1]
MQPDVENLPLHLSPDHPNGIKKLQVGCGPKNILLDWWNVDIRPFPGIDQAMDVTQPWNFENLEYVYGEHFLEHLTLDGAIAFLRQAWNSLKIGGVIRLSTPSLEWVLLTHFDLSESNPKKRVSSTFAINRAFNGWGHQFLYSQEFLTELLENLGYQNILFCEYGQSDHVELASLERHGKYRIVGGYPSVWIVEASRSQTVSEESISHYLNAIENSYLKYARAGH